MVQVPHGRRCIGLWCLTGEKQGCFVSVRGNAGHIGNSGFKFQQKRRSRCGSSVCAKIFIYKECLRQVASVLIGTGLHISYVLTNGSQCCEFRRGYKIWGKINTLPRKDVQECLHCLNGGMGSSGGCRQQQHKSNTKLTP